MSVLSPDKTMFAWSWEIMFVCVRGAPSHLVHVVLNREQRRKRRYMRVLIINALRFRFLA